MKIVKYQVVSNEYIRFQDEVHELIKCGWIPLGGVCESSNPNSGQLYFNQAMILCDNEDEKISNG